MYQTSAEALGRSLRQGVPCKMTYLEKQREAKKCFKDIPVYQSEYKSAMGTSVENKGKYTTAEEFAIKSLRPKANAPTNGGYGSSSWKSEYQAAVGEFVDHKEKYTTEDSRLGQVRLARTTGARAIANNPAFVSEYGEAVGNSIAGKTSYTNYDTRYFKETTGARGTARGVDKEHTRGIYSSEYGARMTKGCDNPDFTKSALSTLSEVGARKPGKTEKRGKPGLFDNLPITSEYQAAAGAQPTQKGQYNSMDKDHKSLYKTLY